MGENIMATIALRAGKQLFHTHITKELFNSLPKVMQNIKWLFDPAKRDVHVRLTELLGGIWGASQRKK